MKSRTLKQLVLYNYRYVFAYLVIIGFSLYFLGWRLTQIGPGLAQPELTSAANHINFTAISGSPVYPLHAILQWASMHLLGITPLAIRLPSVVLAGGTAVLLYFLMKRWFGKSTALLSTAIFVSADWLLFIARLGNGTIEFSFWLTLALLCFTKLLERKSGWLLLYALSIAALLWTPFGIYAVLTLLASLFGYRVFRERFHAIGSIIKALSFAIVLISLAGVVAVSVVHPEFAKDLAGIAHLPSIGQYFKNLFFHSTAIVAVFPNTNPAVSPNGVFFIRFFEAIFMLFGLIMLWKTRINRLNLTVIILTLVMVIVGGLNNQAQAGSLLLIPSAIYMTAGIRHLMHRWKRTFPKNPYARVAAYLPLGVLFAIVATMHYVSYFKLWPTQSATHVAFTRDFSLAQHELGLQKYQGKTCLVQTADTTLQTLLQASNPACRLVFLNDNRRTTSANMVLTQSAKHIQAPLSRGLVSETKEHSLRWIVLSAN